MLARTDNRRAYWVTILVGILSMRGVPAQDLTEFPFANGRVRLSVTINGQGPFPFGFDSGASGLGWVSRSLATRLRLPAAGGFRVSDGKTAVDSDGARIDSLTLGLISIKQSTMPILNSGQCEAGAELECGTLGLDAFKGHTLSLNYPGKKIVLRKGALPPVNGVDVLAYVPSHGAPRADIVIAGIGFNAWIDSGARGTMLLPMALAERLPLARGLSPAGKVASLVTQYDLFKAELAGNLRLGGVTIERPQLFFTDMVKEPTVGRGILQTLVVTFDTLNQSVQFAQPTAQ